MRTVSLRLADLERSTIPIGFQGENLHTQVRIDCKMIYKDYPAAVVSLAVTPPQGDPYPVMVIRDGDIVAWNVTASDTAYHGDGRVQFTFVDGEEVIKTVRGKTSIAESDDPSGTAPTPIQNWITIANVVLDEAARVVEAAIHAPIIDDNGYWAVWDADAEEYVATEYKAQGTDGHDGVGIVSIEKTGTSGLVDTYTITFTSGNPVTYTVTNGQNGTDGISPIATVTKSGKVATITITDKNGTTSETVSDGADADPAALIDDTAGSGATGKTWSADKIAAENLSLMTEINSKANASDVTNLAEDVSDLKSAINAIKTAVISEEQTTVTENIWGNITWTNDYYVAANGTVTSSSSYKYSNKIAVNPGDVLAFEESPYNYLIRFVAAYSDENTVVEAKGSNTGSGSYIVPEGIYYVVISVGKSYSNIALYHTYTQTVFVNNLKDDVEELQEIVEPLDGLAEIVTTDEITSETSTVLITFTDGYITADGTVYGGTSYKYTSRVSASPGNVIDLFSNSGSAHISTARFLTVYKNNSAVSALGGDNVSLPFTVPDGADEIVFSIAASYSSVICKKTVVTTEVVNSEKPRVDALYQILMNAEPNRFISSFDISAGSTYTADKELEDVCGYRICFFAKIGTFTGTTRIGKAETQTYGGAIGFDGTNLYEYLGGISTATRTQAHGLSLKDYIGLVIDLHYDGTAVATLSTNGGSYTWQIPFWRSQYGQITVYSASALSDCVLSYTCEGILKETWLYGDSYFANTGSIRWTAYLISKGYSNFLLNAYPGRGSVAALASLKVDLELGKVPKRIVWCLGMNDKDGDSTPNTNWKSSLDDVIAICNEYNIELVLSTIPNVPSTDCLNTYKNAYVKASGYRYIPFAAAISADESSTWYDGMLETVSGGGYGIHPTEQGALCLFNCAVSAVPELLF